MPPNQYLSTLLRCPHCKARGALTWEKGPEESDGYSALAQISGDFHVETGRIGRDSKLIVCTKCDEIYGPVPASANPSLTGKCVIQR